MDENQIKEKLKTKNTAGRIQANEKINVDNLVSNNTSKTASDSSLEVETDSKAAQDIQHMDPETQSRLKAFLEVAGVKLSHVDARTFQDPEILRKLTNSVSNALDEAATALNKMRSKQGDGDDEKAPIVEGNDGIARSRQQTQTLSTGNVSEIEKNSSVYLPNKEQLTKQQHDVADLQALQHLLGQAGHGIHETAEDGESLLSLACSAGYFELAEVLLRMRASVEDRGIKGDSTPLMEAASGGYADIVKLLMDHGANVNATSSVGNTALTYACCGGFEEVVRILLDNGAIVEHQNENGHTPLMEAASCGHVGVANLLLEYGANINTHSNEFKESALTLACYKGHLGMVKFLLGAGADQDHKTDEMHTALMEACMDGHVEVARLLLDHGAQVNMPVDSFESPLTLAACGGHFELAALLLSRGADLEEVNDEGYTPLMEAAREGHEDVVQLLVDHGANINAQTEETQETALTLACCGGFLEVGQYLVDHGADIELGASTPLMEASQEGHIEIVKYLINKGANIHAVTNTMDTCLTYASANGHTNIVKLLLECGASMEHESEGGRTPLMKAARAGHMETVQFLIAHGADSNRITINNDHTVLSLACAGGHVGIVKYLLVQGANSGHILKDNSTMLIEAARGGHSSVVGLLLQQPKFTTALKNQIAQRQLASTRTADQVASIAGKRRTRSGNTGICGRGKKHLKSPAPRKDDEIVMEKDGMITPITDKEGTEIPATVTTGGDRHALMNKQQQYQLLHQQQQHLSQPVLCRRNTDPDITPPKKTPGSNCGTTKHKESDTTDQSPGQLLCSALNEKIESSVTLRAFDKSFDPSEYTVNPSYKFSQPSLANPDGNIFPVSLPPIQGPYPIPVTNSSAGGNYLLPPIFAQSATYSNQEHMEAYMKADEILRNHMMQLDYAKQQALMNALESLMLQSEAHRASIGILGEDEESDVSNGDNLIVVATEVNGGKNENSNLIKNDVTTDKNDITHDTVGTVANTLKVTSQETLTQSSSIPQWSFTDPSRMPQFSVGVSTLAPSANSPEKQSPKSSHLPSPGKHLSYAEKQAFASRIASRLEQVKHSPNTNTASSDYYSGTPVTQFFNSLDGQTAFHPPLVYNNFNFGSSVDHAADNTGSISPNSSSPNSDFCSPINRTSEASPFKGSIPPSCIQTTPINSIMSSTAPELNQLPPVPSLQNTQYLQPIYSPDLASLKHLTHRIPPPDVASTQHFDANHSKSLPLTSSIWLDANFPLDIPPPSDLIPEHLHHMIPGGYSGHLLETDSLSSDEYEEEEDDEINDVLTSHPDLPSVPAGSYEPAIDIDQQTDSNHDTALTLAAAGGHDDLVELLLERGSEIEHRDKKGCTPIILAANAGHAMTVAILLEHNADMESQTDRTKDTALSLACSSGRQEVVELLLAKGANFEHRNVSDYTPLSLAASGGYVAIIKMLLKVGADINSRTGSKLGISPLMLAAMNGHTATVKLLLDFGSDINSQIETNRNTALTLACFQGRHEVVSLLVERQANVEHRAKTGLTPLMEAASGGYHEVGMVLINKSADVNAAPVPSSRDTALTIAADKGHYKFVDLLLRCGAYVDVRNKKGNSPLWLSANGGHLDVTRLLIDKKADVDSQDNRKVSCLMAAFRKGHYKVVRYLVEHVSQFPSDADLNRYINTLSDKELIKKCQRCMEVVIHAKERQAAEANKNASILLQELDQERQHEENRRAAIARKRARKKKQKEKKKAQEKETKNGVVASSKNVDEELPIDNNISDKENIDKRHELHHGELESGEEGNEEKGRESSVDDKNNSFLTTVSVDVSHSSSALERISAKGITTTIAACLTSSSVSKVTMSTYSPLSPDQPVVANLRSSTFSSPRRGKKEEGWKEVGKRAKKLSVPASKFGQVIGRNSANIILIKSYTGVAIEIEKCSRQAPTRTLLIKGSHESLRQAQQCIVSLQRDPNCDLLQLLQVKMQSNTLKSQSVDSIQCHMIDTLEPSWKVAGKVTNSSSKPKLSQSMPFVANITAPTLVKQTSGPLKPSKSTGVIERKGSLSSMGSIDKIVKPSVSFTAVSVYSTTSWINSTVQSPASPAIGTPKSGAVRQLFTSSASSNQLTSTNTVTGVKMSPSLSLQKPPTQNLSTIPFSTSWKQVSGMTAVPPSPSTVNSKVLLANITDDRRPQQQQSVSNSFQPVVSSKLAFQSSSTTHNNNSDGESAQNVFEQILKTPSLFGEVASQITQPKKYSDAVGKKPLLSDVAANKALITVNISTNSQLINRAPGTKPVGLDQLVKHTISTPPVQQQQPAHDIQIAQQRRTSPWNDESTCKDDIDFNISGENISPGSSLGPIAPPSRSTMKPAMISPKNHPSPQRPLQTPPVAKSPLLGPAPPGLLPLPDKTIFRPIHPEGSELANVVPTQMPTPVRNSRPPLLATPPGFPTQLIQGGIAKSRSETGKRSPLPKRIHYVNPGSPFQGVTESDSRSPTKSPSQQQQQQHQQQSLGQMLALNNKPLSSSNFNPNAPSFIPMGMPQIAQTTSSILGNPPSNLKYSLPVPTSSSILGTAPPQLQTSIGGPIPQQTMTPPVVTGHPPPPPVPPPPPPPILPPMINSQPSLLGNPPFPLLVPQTGQGVPQPPQPPPSTNHPPMFYGNQYDNNVPVTLPPPSLIQNLPNQFPSHPSMAITPRDIVAEQFPGPGLRNESSPVFGFSPGNYPIEGLSPQIGAENGPNSLGRWDPKFGGQRILNESTDIDDPSVVNIGERVGTSDLPYPHTLTQDVKQTLATSSHGTFTGPLPQPMISAPRSSVCDGHTCVIDEISDNKPGSGISAFSVLPPGISTNSGLWTFTPPSLGISEDSGWSKPSHGVSTSLLGYMSSDWPVMTSSVLTKSNLSTTKPELSNIVILPQDNLQTVLEKLGLGNYYHVFKRNYIDLPALMLMSEEHFTEVGIPKGPRIKLLNALGRQTSIDLYSQISDKEDDIVNEDSNGNMSSLNSISSSTITPSISL